MNDEPLPDSKGWKLPEATIALAKALRTVSSEKEEGLWAWLKKSKENDEEFPAADLSTIAEGQRISGNAALAEDTWRQAVGALVSPRGDREYRDLIAVPKTTRSIPWIHELLRRRDSIVEFRNQAYFLTACAEALARAGAFREARELANDVQIPSLRLLAYARVLEAINSRSKTNRSVN